MDVDKWVHLNCALWSSEVYETLNGDLMNVDVAHGRCKTLECQACKKIGATLGCFKVNCSKVYHLGCAQKSGCMFFQDKVSQDLLDSFDILPELHEYSVELSG
jgi:hypothetical protein